MRTVYQLDSLTTADLSDVASDRALPEIVRGYARNLCESRRFIVRAALDHSTEAWRDTMLLYQGILASQARRLPIEYQTAARKPLCGRTS
jgi:hypothetical protein